VTSSTIVSTHRCGSLFGPTDERRWLYALPDPYHDVDQG
jgi:hypothetical protein